MLPPVRMSVVDAVVGFDAPVDAVFGYLADPANRPQWQSSLRRVDDLRPLGERPGDVGTSWTDVTVVPGVSPRMEVTAYDKDRRWQEIGRWRSVDAVLTLTFTERSGGTYVHAEGVLTVPMVGAPVLLTTRWPAGRAIRADLQKAARIVGR